MVGMAIFIAIIGILQLVATFIKFGPFEITLALAPIVVGAVMYGPRAGAVFGGAFGVVVLIACIGGLGGGGTVLWLANPLLTAALCLLKGALAGYAAGLTYSAASKINMYFGVVCAALVCPIVNTGIFIAAMALFYRDILISWAGDTHLIYFAIIGLTGINFLLEFGINIVLSPGILRIINAVKAAKKA